MTSEPRMHHFLPEFYLAGFTDSVDGRLHLIDLTTGQTRDQRPRKVGRQRDFYRVEGIDEVEPTEVETVFARFEAEVSPVIQEIRTADSLPTDPKALGDLISFVALLAARTPSMRSALERPIVELWRKTLALMTRTPQAFEAASRRSGVSFGDATALELARDAIIDGSVTIEASQAFCIGQLLEMWDHIVQHLSRRNWSLLTAAEGCAFIVSDNPVVLVSTQAEPSAFYPPAFGAIDTDVLMPLSSRHALLGSHGVPVGNVLVSQREVALINSLTYAKGARFVGSAHVEIAWLMADGSIGNAEQLRQDVQKRLKTK